MLRNTTYHKMQNKKGYLTALLSLFCVILLAACFDTGPAQEEGKTDLITLEEVLRLGDESAGDTILFGSVSQIVVNGRGDIIVAESNPRLIHTFGLDGTYLGSLGGQGQGPGEYLYFSGPVIGPADSVYLWEIVTNRVLIYDPDDFSWVRSIEVEDDGEKQVSLLIGAIENGLIMAMGLPPILDSDDGSMMINDDNHYELIKVNPNGHYETDLFGTAAAGEMIYNIQGSGFNFISVPFARSPAWAVGPNDMLYYGWSDAIEITVVSADGSTREVISYEHDPVPITDAEIDEEQPENEFFREIWAAHEHHETKPAFQTFVVDEMGRVWIKLSTREDAVQAEWLILNRESHAVGSITLPVAVNLETIRDGYAYGRDRESDGAPMVVVYEIQE